MVFVSLDQRSGKLVKSACAVRNEDSTHDIAWRRSRPQRPRSFWSAPRITTFGRTQFSYSRAIRFDRFDGKSNSRPQRPRSFWSAPRITTSETSDQVQHRKSAIHGLPVTLRMLRVKFEKSDWFWSQSMVFTKPFKTGMSFDLARGRDSWCWPKGARPLGTSMGKSVNRGFPVLLRMLRKLVPARGRDSWCWPKGGRPLGKRIA